MTTEASMTDERKAQLIAEARGMAGHATQLCLWWDTLQPEEQAYVREYAQRAISAVNDATRGIGETVRQAATVLHKAFVELGRKLVMQYGTGVLWKMNDSVAQQIYPSVLRANRRKGKGKFARRARRS